MPEANQGAINVEDQDVISHNKRELNVPSFDNQNTPDRLNNRDTIIRQDSKFIQNEDISFELYPKMRESQNWFDPSSVTSDLNTSTYRMKQALEHNTQSLSFASGKERINKSLA